MRFTLAALALLPVVAVAQFHEGDLVTGVVNGQARVVMPTDLLTNPRVYTMDWVPPEGNLPGFFTSDVGFDYWNLGQGIGEIGSARLVSRFISEELRVLSAGRTYFSRDAEFQSFVLTGTRRHRHFAFETRKRERARTFAFQFQLIEASDVFGNPVADSPIYTLRFRTPPMNKADAGWSDEWNGGDGPPPVPEPATLAVLGAGLFALARRRRK